MIYAGYTTNGTLNYAPSPAVTVTVNYSTVNGYAKSVPVPTPYGYIAIPDDNSTCIYNGMGDFNASAVTGYTNQLSEDRNVAGLLKGEVALLSKGNYTFQIKNDKLYMVFTNAAMDVVSTRVAIDENVNTLSIDTIAEIAALETKVNVMIGVINQLVNTIPTLQAGVGGTLASTSTTPIPAYIPTTNYTRDQTFVNQSPSKMFVDTNGEIIS